MGAVACISRDSEEQDLVACQPVDSSPRNGCGFSASSSAFPGKLPPVAEESPLHSHKLLEEKVRVAEEKARLLEGRNRVLEEENANLQERLRNYKPSFIGYSDRGRRHRSFSTQSVDPSNESSCLSLPQAGLTWSCGTEAFAPARRKFTTFGETPKACGRRRSQADLDTPHELVNDLIAGTWPFISKYFEREMRVRVEPLVQAHMPAGISIRVGEHCHLGNTPVVLESLKTFKYVHPGAKEEEDSTNLRVVADVNFVGDCVIEANLSAGIGQVEIHGVEVSGIMVCEFAHLSSYPPWFTGLRIFFANAPEIELKVGQKMLGMHLNLSWVKSIIVNALTTVLSNCVVLPNRLVIPIGRVEEELSLRYLRPQGVLRVQLVRASNLHGRRLLSADPYVTATVGAMQWRSKAVKNTLDPVWDETEIKDFMVMDYQAQVLRVVVRDADYGSGALKTSDFLGRAQLELGDALAGLGDGHPQEFRIPLEIEGGYAGEIVLQVQWRRFTRIRDMERVAALPKDKNCWSIGPNCSGWGLFVGLHGATGLSPAPDGTEHWASLRITGAWEDAAAELTAETPAFAAASQIQEGLRILRKASDAAEVLAGGCHCDVSTVRHYLQQLGGAKNGHTANSKVQVEYEVGSTLDVRWETPFLFLLDVATDAQVEVTVWRPSQGKERYPRMSKVETIKKAASGLFKKEETTKELGEVTYKVKHLLQCPRFTSIVSLPLNGRPGGPEVKLRLQLRPLQPPDTRSRSRVGSVISHQSSHGMTMSKTSTLYATAIDGRFRKESMSKSTAIRWADCLNTTRPDSSLRDRTATANIDDWCSASSGSDFEDEDDDFDSVGSAGDTTHREIS